MARHWRAAYDYAAICLVSTGSPASIVTAAAFHRVLEQPSGGALRTQLLAAVRDMVKEWAAQDDISALLPELRKPTGGRGLRAARSVTPERRQLAERAFRALPGASQCLLWHTEVEAEPITIPAGLLGVDPGTATVGLERAREQFRSGCVRAHRELAPTRECRYYNRLLDVPIRRGGDLLPDVRQHLMECRYCRHAAEQLSHFEGGLEVLLAETVLGWGARRYLDSRPGRGGTEPGSDTRQRTGGRHRPDRPTPPQRRAKAVAVGVGLTSFALLVTVLAVKGWSEENGGPAPHATWGVATGNSVHPSGVSGPSDPASPSDPGSPSAASAADPAAIAQGRLRNLDSGLCLDLRGGRLRADTPARLVACSSAVSQQWSYRHDGLLRSAADPTFCLDSTAGSGSDVGTVVLADCLVHAGEVRYDLTVHGELLPRGADGLAVAPGKGGSVVVADRDGSARQRWLLDVETADGSRTEGGAAEDSPKKAPEEKPDKEPDKKPDKKGEDELPDGSAPEPPGRESPDALAPVSPDAAHTREPEGEGPGQPEPLYETRYVQADSDQGEPEHEPEPEPGPAAQVHGTVTLPVAAPATVSPSATTVSATTRTATTALGSTLR